MPPLSAFLSRLPTAVGGIALASVGLGNAWALCWPGTADWLQPALSLLSALLLALLWGKFLLLPRVVRNELRQALPGSVWPTLTMATLLLANQLTSANLALAQGIWLMAISLQFLLAGAYFVHRWRSPAFTDIGPNWFVPAVGFAVAAVSSAGMQMPALARGLFWFGFSWYVLLLPLVLYRLLRLEPLPQAARPTLTVMAAPASMCMAGYLTVYPEPNPIMLWGLLPLAVVMTLSVYRILPSLLRLPFTPGQASLTFPLVIGSIALFKLEVIADSVLPLWLHTPVHLLAQLELLVASLVWLTVMGRFFNNLVLVPTRRRATGQPG